MKEIITNDEVIYISNICRDIYERYVKAVEDRGEFNLVLSGGNTPKLIYRKMSESYKDIINWGKVNFFWTDERFVPDDHQDSNYFSAWSGLLQYTGFGKVYKFDTALGLDDSIKAFEKQFDTIKARLNQPAFLDYVLLGMGEDGHVASIFALEDAKHSGVCFSSAKEENGYQRISLTANTLNSARYVMLMVSNNKKREILKSKQHYPVGLINIDCCFTLKK